MSNITQLNDAHYGTIDGWLDANGYESIDAWGRDSDYLLTDSDGWVDLDDNPVDLYEQAWYAYEAEKAADDAERDPVEHHFTIVGTETPEGIEWTINLGTPAYEGTVYDPNSPTRGWRLRTEDEDAQEERLIADLETRIAAKLTY